MFGCTNSLKHNGEPQISRAARHIAKRVLGTTQFKGHGTTVQGRPLHLAARDQKAVMRRKDTPEVPVTFRRYRRDPRTGRVLDAHYYGYKAWPMRFKKKK